MSTTLPSIRMVWHERRLPDSAQKRHNSTMSKRLIPLFPLQLVVFPRTRFRCTFSKSGTRKWWATPYADNSEFGIVLAKEAGF